MEERKMVEAKEVGKQDTNKVMFKYRTGKKKERKKERKKGRKKDGRS